MVVGLFSSWDATGGQEFRQARGIARSRSQGDCRASQEPVPAGVQDGCRPAWGVHRLGVSSRIRKRNARLSGALHPFRRWLQTADSRCLDAKRRCASGRRIPDQSAPSSSPQKNANPAFKAIRRVTMSSRHERPTRRACERILADGCSRRRAGFKPAPALGWHRQAKPGDDLLRGEGVSPLRVAGILPATRKSKGRMPSPRIPSPEPSVPGNLHRHNEPAWEVIS